jgi:hypothetical protein
MEFFNEDFYKRKRERAVADGTAGAVDTAIDLGNQVRVGRMLLCVEGPVV